MITKPHSNFAQTTDDPLATALEQLQRAIAGNTANVGEWRETMECAVVEIENALRHHRGEERAQDGVLAEVDKTRPTMVRDANDVRAEHTDLLHDAIELRRAARDASADPAAIRTQAEELLARLRQNRESETQLLQESVNTDIGVGD
jgi:hypothetical protein